MTQILSCMVIQNTEQIRSLIQMVTGCLFVSILQKAVRKNLSGLAPFGESAWSAKYNLPWQFLFVRQGRGLVGKPLPLFMSLTGPGSSLRSPASCRQALSMIKCQTDNSGFVMMVMKKCYTRIQIGCCRKKRFRSMLPVCIIRHTMTM